MRASAEPSAPAALRTVFERLEYGKLCLSPEGPIEKGGEAYPLVRSAGFPRALEPLCHPATIGVGGSDLPAGVTEGWVLRGVLHAGGLTSIACRFRLRPEDREGGIDRRRYWLGRYLYCPDGPADPFAFFLALRDQPLRSITAAETRNAWLPIAVEDDRPTAVDPFLHAFLWQAVVYAVSAVPIGLSPLITPERFFLWASALGSLLPPGLRPAFAAGWGVTSSVASALNLSFAPGYAPDVAVFDLDKCLWHGPVERVVLTGRSEERSLPWQDSELTPGRMYLRESFPWSEGEPELDFLAPDLDHLADLDLGTVGAESPEVIDLRSPWVRDLFIRPGLCSLDYARCHLLQTWLADPAMPEPQGLCVSAADYFTPATRLRVLRIALRSLAGEIPNPRGARVLWSSLRDDPGIQDEVEALGEQRETPGRARLLLSLARGDSEAVLKIFAGVPGVEDSLPPEAERLLQECLDASLESGADLGPHREILRRAVLPKLYREWVECHLRRLALALMSGTDGRASLEALAQLTTDPFVQTIARWQQGMAPTQKDAQELKAAGEDLRKAFGQRFLAVWSESRGGTVEWRERLLSWVEPLFPAGLPRESDPLLRIRLEGADLRLGSGEERWLAETIGEGAVLPSLQAPVSAVVLRAWDSFAPEYQGARRGWTEIFALWPTDVRTALLGTSAAGKKEVDVAPEVQRAAETLCLSSRRLRDLLATRRGSRQVAERLWSWCLNARNEDRILAPDICRDLVQRCLPPERVSLEEASLAADLAERVDFFSREPALLRQLWEQAESAVQILLLLACAPGANLVPSLAQLEVLVPRREELRKHLAARNLHEDRRRRFEIATREFHDVDPRAKSRPRGDYRDSVLWAAFQGIPFERQGDLKRALEVYAAGEEGHLFNQRRVQLATYYLAQYQEQDELEQAVRLVARALVLPLAEESGVDRRTLIKILRRMFEERSRRKKISILESGDAGHAFRLTEDGVLIARWFKNFLLQIHDCERGEALLSELGR